MAQNNITIGDGFHVTAAKPLDDRAVVNTLQELNTLHDVYIGLSVFCESTQQKYTYLGIDSKNNRIWRPENVTGQYSIGFEGGSTVASDWNLLNDIQITEIHTEGVSNLWVMFGNNPEQKIDLTQPIPELKPRKGERIFWRIAYTEGNSIASLGIAFKII